MSICGCLVLCQMGLMLLSIPSLPTFITGMFTYARTEQHFRVDAPRHCVDVIFTGNSLSEGAITIARRPLCCLNTPYICPETFGPLRPCTAATAMHCFIIVCDIVRTVIRGRQMNTTLFWKYVKLSLLMVLLKLLQKMSNLTITNY